VNHSQEIKEIKTLRDSGYEIGMDEEEQLNSNYEQSPQVNGEGKISGDSKEFQLDVQEEIELFEPTLRNL
jgi:hypothetical protein